MRQFTTQHIVYNFNELTEEAQACAVEKRRDYVYEYGLDFISDDMEWKLIELLKEYKLTYNVLPKIYYSLGCSQGDGAMFEGTVFYKAWQADIKHSGYYYHYNSKEIQLASQKTDSDAPENTYNTFNGIYVDICKALEKYGYDCIEYVTDEKNIRQELTDDDLEYNLNGEISC